MTTFCLCENRELEEIGLRIAVCSIQRHCPGSNVVIYRAGANQRFADWLRDYPTVTLIAASPPNAIGWNCKPHALLPLLRNGAKEVVWLDSDVVLAGDPRHLFASWSDDTLGVCEEYRTATHQGSRTRTEGWGMPVGREFPRTLNSAVVRVTPAHVALLEKWQELLEDPRYVPWQSRPLYERPHHVWSDQDVLNALLGSSEFSAIPVTLLRTGREIIHCGNARSYHLWERLGGLLRQHPPIVHAQGEKPWVTLDAGVIASKRQRFWATARVIQEVSLYRFVATSYRADLGLPCPWLDYWSSAGRMVAALGLGHHSMRGLPLAATASLIKLLRNKN
jgi:hypothetical protein